MQGKDHEVNQVGDTGCDKGGFDMAAVSIDNQEMAATSSCDRLEDMGDPLQCECIVRPACVTCGPLPTDYKIKHTGWEVL